MATAHAVGGRAPRPLLRAVVRLLGLARRVEFRAAAMVAAVVASITLVAVEAPIAAVTYDVQPVLAFGLAVLHAGCIPLALLRPRLAGMLAVVAVVPLQVLSAGQVGPAWPWWVVLVITHSLVVFLVGVRAPWTASLVLWALPIVVSAGIAYAMNRRDHDSSSIDVVVFASISGACLIVAMVLGQWNRIRGQLLRERRLSAEEHSRRVLVEERARIARELHDVIAHSMSIITVQATTARFRNPGFGAAAIAEFDEIGASSRQALDEMRGLLDVLRAGEQAAELRPQPRFEDVPELVQQAERAGMDVRSAWPADSDGVGDVAGLATYRIVQEALSNAIRHAAGATVRVTGTRAAGRIRIEVINSPPPLPGPVAVGSTDGGHGLVGMAERAASVGGTLRSGPTEEGGFAVHADLPAGTAARAPARAEARG